MQYFHTTKKRVLNTKTNLGRANIFSYIMLQIVQHRNSEFHASAIIGRMSRMTNNK